MGWRGGGHANVLKGWVSHALRQGMHAEVLAVTRKEKGMDREAAKFDCQMLEGREERTHKASRVEERTGRQEGDQEQVKPQKIPGQRREMVTSVRTCQEVRGYAPAVWSCLDICWNYFQVGLGIRTLTWYCFLPVFSGTVYLSLAQYESVHWSFTRSRERQTEGNCVGSLSFPSFLLNTLTKAGSQRVTEAPLGFVTFWSQTSPSSGRSTFTHRVPVWGEGCLAHTHSRKTSCSPSVISVFPLVGVLNCCEYRIKYLNLFFFSKRKFFLLVIICM